VIFVDYYGTNKLNPKTFQEVLSGIVEGCKQAGTSLLGGETAEMVDTYSPHVEFDLVGPCVGFALEEELIKPQERIKKGDVLIGLESNGFHANGFSLIRRVLENKGIDLEKFSPHFGAPPLYFVEKKTRIYVRELLAALRRYRTLIHGLAHITGGGIVENLSRIFPNNLSPFIDLEKWEVPKEFQVLQELGEISYGEMFRTFNMGIGFVVVLDERATKSFLNFLKGTVKYKVTVIGRVDEGDGNVKFV
jgi:phosphoribosylformylglycinamidine cyclo-ligase